ncbi:MAG TPA: class I SAM-dependent methyltransferase [Dissulfurispiraceae bacterium]
MINRLHSLFYRPEKGWDPVSSEYAAGFAKGVLGSLDFPLLNELEGYLSGFEGKRILDLGAGPGQYSVAFAQRSAEVVWHDISRNYMEIARQQADAAGVGLSYSLGYLEDAKRFAKEPFDLVFCRLCWNYCFNDRSFARLIYSLVKPGGIGYVDTHTPGFQQSRDKRKLVHFLNEVLGLKVGHIYPPSGRVEKLFERYPLDKMIPDYGIQDRERILFVKSR